MSDVQPKPVVYAEVVAWDRARVRIRSSSTSSAGEPQAWLSIHTYAAALSVAQVRVIRDGLNGWLRDFGGDEPVEPPSRLNAEIILAGLRVWLDTYPVRLPETTGDPGLAVIQRIRELLNGGQ